LAIYWILTLAGFCISVLSALESRVKWIASFCALFGEGCRRTEDFSLFKIPVSWWGIGYYLFLAFLLYFATPGVFWFVMAGFGFELTFLWIMVSIRAFCIFCIFNAAVVAGLVWASFDPSRIWQSATVALFFFMSSNHLISRENTSQISQEQAEAPESAVATVNGETITREALERPLSQQIYELNYKIYRLKRRRLEKMIQNVLLAKEAKRRKISREELREMVLSEDQKVSGEKKSEIIANYVNRLKEKHEVKIFLQKPSLPLTRIDIEDSPVLGPAGARVVVVEFSDLLCPACREAHHTTRRIREAYGDQIRWVFKDFPLERHKGAAKAAQAAHCAGEQDKFWEYQDIVIHSGEENPDAGRLTAYAQKLGLDREQFGSCLNNGKYRERIENDIQSGKKAGISAIPTFIINGKMISGKLSYDGFKQKIDEALNASQKRIYGS
jgi:protein-disulfide isomerase